MGGNVHKLSKVKILFMITDMGVKWSFNYNISIPLDTDVYQNEKPSYYIKVRVRMHIFYKLRLL